MKNLKLLSFILPISTLACAGTTIGCSCSKEQIQIEGEWTEFTLNTDSDPIFLSSTTIDLVGGKTYRARFKLDGPEEEFSHETAKFEIYVANTGQPDKPYDFTQNPTAELDIEGTKEIETIYDSTNETYYIQSEWSKSFLGKNLEFTFKCEQDYEKATICFFVVSH